MKLLKPPQKAVTDSSVNLQAPPMATVIPGPSSSSGLQMKTGMTGAPASNEPMRAGLSQSRKSLLNHSSTGGCADGEQGKPTTCCPAPLRRCRLFLERLGFCDSVKSPTSIIWLSSSPVACLEIEPDSLETHSVLLVPGVSLLHL